MTNTIVRRSTTKARNVEIVYVSVEDMSKDMLLSYINVMRQLVSLEPIIENKTLGARARQKAYYVRQQNMQSIEADRSPFSVIKNNAGAWIDTRNFRKRPKTGAYVDTHSHLGSSSEYLSSILSNRCSTIGIHECSLETTNGKSPCLVQVLEMESVV